MFEELQPREVTKRVKKLSQHHTDKMQMYLCAEYEYMLTRIYELRKHIMEDNLEEIHERVRPNI